jgi:hypothetical protein
MTRAAMILALTPQQKEQVRKHKARLRARAERRRELAEQGLAAGEPFPFACDVCGEKWGGAYHHVRGSIRVCDAWVHIYGEPEAYRARTRVPVRRGGRQVAYDEAQLNGD